LLQAAVAHRLSLPKLRKAPLRGRSAASFLHQ
jgi:hypothetical protein